MRFISNCELCNGTYAAVLASTNRMANTSFYWRSDNAPLVCYCKSVDARLPRRNDSLGFLATEPKFYLRAARNTDVRGGDLPDRDSFSNCEGSWATGCKVCGGVNGVKEACMDSFRIWGRPSGCVGFVMEPDGRCGWLKANVSARTPREGWTTYAVQPTPP